MAKKRVQQKRDSIGRFLQYVLGLRPDEFGLAPDEEGYVPIKDLLKALSEEEGFKNVRMGNIEELLREPDGSGLEVSDKLIRVDPGRTSLTIGPFEPVMPPKLLYHAARKKGYPVILEHGLKPGGGQKWVILTADKDMALRIGKRRGPDPVLLTVFAERAYDRGVEFFRPQEELFLVESLTPDLFSGPPLPKEKEGAVKKKKPKKEEIIAPTDAGSFVPRPDSVYDNIPLSAQEKKKKSGEPEWKKASKKQRRKEKW